MKVAYSKDYVFKGKFQDYFVIYRIKTGDIELIKSLKFIDSKKGYVFTSVNGRMLPTDRSKDLFGAELLNKLSDRMNECEYSTIGEVI